MHDNEARSIPGPHPHELVRISIYYHSWFPLLRCIYWPQVIYDSIGVDNDGLVIQFWLSDLTLRDAMNDMKKLIQL
jgi:hypothetical protein